MSTPLPRMNTLFVGCEPRLPGSLNAMKGTNQLSLPASLPFSAALSLHLRLLNLSRLDAAMMNKQSNSCVPSFATTKWSCAFLGSRTPFMLCKRNRHWPVGLSPLQRRLLHISPPCQRASNLTLPLLRNSINLPRQEVKLRRDQLQRLQPPLHQKAPLLDLFLLPTPANPLPARPTPLLLPIVVLHARQLGHTLRILISEPLLQPVKVRAPTQGKARALVPPTPILLAKARRAKKARKARRVKKVKTLKATRAKKGNKENTLGPSWKVARVQPRVIRNNCFSPSVHPAISCVTGSSFYTFHSLLPPLSIRLTAFNRLTSTFLLHAHTLPPAARTQSVIPAHSVLCSF